ncbi:hypothetical protein XENTR_v10019768 [Xenopus tropicalis]|nr:hypothetical protein XENTR_v10019768 [Xenopus tropicalis]
MADNGQLCGSVPLGGTVDNLCWGAAGWEITIFQLSLNPSQSAARHCPFSYRQLRSDYCACSILREISI